MAITAFGLTQTITQRTALTLSQRQSVELLQLTGPELQAQIDTVLATNPLVEATDNAGFESDRTPEAIAPETLACDEPAGVAHDFKEPSFLTWAGSPTDDDDYDPFAKVSSEENLADVLMQQASEMHLDAQVRWMLQWLIGNLDENGFLAEGLEACAQSYPEPVDVELWPQALKLLQSMDPAGVGAADAIESLVLQLGRLQDEHGSVARHAVDLLTQAKDLVLKRDFKTAAHNLGISYEETLEAFSLICKLNPHPAAEFATSDEIRYVVPEVIVQKTPEGFTAVLNPAVIPHLRFDAQTFELITQAKLSGEEKTLWKNRADEAKHFVKSVEQRFSTIVAVAQTIVNMQPQVFVAGLSALKPMGLKDVAAKLDMAESTVSRATAGKYMQTPLGTFEFKSFFTSSVAGTDGASVSSTAVRRRIAEIVAAEDPKKPLSDGAIADVLAKEGIEVARRTVAKYRELEHIAPKSLRKALV
ncbi:MAG: RNA polymerase factor sigma-54 [Sutterellaceae bacterium]|nr:RNA polymerase factor sigma-54 [Sutterellaceae bacterium]